ncbi:hypothetical protein BKA93DRAFT_494369 [Sparassis latifolia]
MLPFIHCAHKTRRKTNAFQPSTCVQMTLCLCPRDALSSSTRHPVPTLHRAFHISLLCLPIFLLTAHSFPVVGHLTLGKARCESTRGRGHPCPPLIIDLSASLLSRCLITTISSVRTTSIGCAAPQTACTRCTVRQGAATTMLVSQRCTVHRPPALGTFTSAPQLPKCGWYTSTTSPHCNPRCSIVHHRYHTGAALHGSTVLRCAATRSAVRAVTRVVLLGADLVGAAAVELPAG